MYVCASVRSCIGPDLSGSFLANALLELKIIVYMTGCCMQELGLSLKVKVTLDLCVIYFVRSV